VANYVKEVQSIVDLGVPAEDVIKMFDAITDNFTEYYSVVDSDQFHEVIGDLRRTDKRWFRQIIDEVASEYGLSWREVKYEETRVKRCETCMSWFYGTARNGKTLTCERFGVFRRFNLTTREFYYREKDGRRLSECAVKYELARRPVKRRVNEVLYDPIPNRDATKEQAIKQSVEEAYQRQLNPDANAWTYWNR
jgi:hypothetical protein